MSDPCTLSGKMPILKGEDRAFGGNDLIIDLIPKSCWFSNVRTSISAGSWNKLRQLVYERANHGCECCGNAAPPGLEAHERWYYDMAKQTQQLVRIIALCKKCHEVTHFGRTEFILCRGDEAQAHQMKVRGWTLAQFMAHKTEAFTTWRERNQLKWELDLTLITANGMELKRTYTPAERAQQAQQQALEQQQQHEQQQHEQQQQAQQQQAQQQQAQQQQEVRESILAYIRDEFPPE